MHDIQQQVALFTSMAAEKLRKQGSVCGSIMVFLLTNRHREDKPQQFANRLIRLPVSTDSTLELVNVAARTAEELVQAPYEYKKAGVILSDVTSKSAVQTVLFDEVDHDKQDKLMSALDAINKKQGPRSVVVASAGFDGIRMNREHLSPNYTSEWGEILVVKS